MTILNPFQSYRLVALAIVIVALASCSGSDAPAAPGAGVGLSTPTAKSPVGGAVTQTLRPTLEVNNAVATGGSVGTVTYRFELSEASDFPVGSRTTAVDNVPQGASSTSAVVPSELLPAKQYYWHARATNGTVTTSYSATESFRADDRGFINGQTIVDPLTNGQTVAHERHGGTFVTGENGGWQTESLHDSLDYNIPTCPSCRVEFDVTNFDRSTSPENIDQKWFSMGDGSMFNNINDFRNHDWKMHVEKRSGDGGAIELIWRRGCSNDEAFCDNTDNFKVPIAWEPLKVYHFTIEWGSGAMSVRVCEWNGTSCGATVYSATSGTGNYTPPNHRIELGTRPRGETLIGARFRNLKVGPK